MNSAKVSLIFPAYNRLEFTRQSWAALMANTDWSLVQEFHVYDDGSTDGTREWLEREFVRCTGGTMPPATFAATNFYSPMGVTIDWIKHSKAPLLAKLDNDTIYPPGWLPAALAVMRLCPELQMLGLECMRQPVAVFADNDPLGTRGYLPARFVSGLGMYRAAAFSTLPQDDGYFGFEEWMQARRLKCGWILPSLPVFLLDRLPMEPWRSLSEEYVRKGWQRPWSGADEKLRYKPCQSAMWDWWKPVQSD